MSIYLRAVAPLRQISAAIDAEDHTALILKASALLCVLYGASTRRGAIPVLLISGLMLTFPSLLRARSLWWALVAILCLNNVHDWYFIDNHKYLITYWTLACALSLDATRIDEYLGAVARALVGVIFAAAVIWKLWGGQFLDGTFFTATVLLDSRLSVIGATLASLPVSELTLLRSAFNVTAINGLDSAIQLPVTFPVTVFAVILSLVTLIVEGAVALTHVVPFEGCAAARRITLTVFILGTYLLLPVVPFATTLCILGLAQSNPEDLRSRREFLALLVFVQFTQLPWQEFLFL